MRLIAAPPSDLKCSDYISLNEEPPGELWEVLFWKRSVKFTFIYVL